MHSELDECHFLWICVDQTELSKTDRNGLAVYLRGLIALIQLLPKQKSATHKFGAAGYCICHRKIYK